MLNPQTNCPYNTLKEMGDTNAMAIMTLWQLH